MYVENAIDIVIPSFRLDEDTLIKIINVDQPLNFKINFYIIADNPAIAVPESILKLAENGTINLVKNEKNLGFSKTRNKGITLGKSKWLLLLDDDITPEKTLLIAYANAIAKNHDAIGFAGVTNFPKPFNSTTLALEVNGDTGHCKSAGQYAELMWVPTTNIMLNRESMDPSLFNENLKKGGEDIEFLVRNALLNNKKYIGVPDAIVAHPWWPGGTTKRLFRYGAGAAQIASLPAIKKYTYHNFTNTAETLLLLILCSPLIVINFSWGVLIEMVLILVGVEFVINCFRSVYLIKKFSLGVAVNLFWIKNCYEVGYLMESLLKGRLSGFGERVDMAFTRENPSWFRLNKWKMLKVTFLLILFTIILL
ncbi:glycosyltransferase involved in cell wall biosynthesis [Pedobacter sp. CG_S7]|uniref:glycosyltransferase family 2 protein n=1 Tax=Pedobacter sp. CG_S7 TaxID=3143930 RepID=UPI003393F04C